MLPVPISEHGERHKRSPFSWTDEAGKPDSRRMKHHLSIDEETMAVLKRATITETSVTLPSEMLAKPLYEKVNKALNAAGGKWTGKLGKGGHHKFTRDPREALGMAIETGQLKDAKKATQAFYTPPEIARRVVLAASLAGKIVLEPSAGTGAIADAAREVGAKEVICVELDPHSAEEMQEKGYKVLTGDFLTYTRGITMSFDRIVMNPPFTAGQDVDHVTHAFGFLNKGGRLVAIISPAFKTNTTKRYSAFRDLMAARGRIDAELAPGTFKESGTNVATVIVILDKP